MPIDEDVKSDEKVNVTNNIETINYETKEEKVNEENKDETTKTNTSYDMPIEEEIVNEVNNNLSLDGYTLTLKM